jgi:hypothetical protein
MLAAVLALCGCYPTSHEAIGISKGVANDPALSGTWLGHIAGDQGTTYLFFLQHPPEPEQAMIVRVGDGKDPGEWASFSIVLGKAGGSAILNAVFENGSLPRDDTEDYTPLLYRFEADGALHFFLMNSLAAEDAVRANRLGGEIVSAGKNADVTLTGDPETIDAYFAANATKFFTVDFGTFKRVN